MLKVKAVLVMFLLISSGSEPVFSDSDFDKAYDLLKQEKYEDALYYYEKALAANPLSQDIWMEYTGCLRKLKRLQKAAQAGWRALELGTENNGLWGNLGNVFLDAHAWESAFEAYRKAADLSKDLRWSVQNFLNLGYEQWLYNDNSGALKSFNFACDLDKTNGLAVLDRGILFASTGDVKKGTSEIKRAIEILEKSGDNNGLLYAKKSLERIQRYGKIVPFSVEGKSYQYLPGEFLKQPPKGEALNLEIKSSVSRFYPVADKTLQLETPESWHESINIDEKRDFFTITFSDKFSTKRFKLLITPLKLSNDLSKVKSLVETTGTNLLENSVEDKLTLIEVNGKMINGYAYVLTDKTYKPEYNNPEDFPYLIQGLIQTKDTSFSFTILSLSKDKGYLDSIMNTIINLSCK